MWKIYIHSKFSQAKILKFRKQRDQVFILDNFSFFPIFPMLIEDIEDIFPYPVNNIENDERGLKS
jgi:hypothetical protein